MHNPMTSRHAWCTASHTDATNSTGADLRVLRAHLGDCPQMHRHLMTLNRVAQSINGFVVTRFVTTLVMVAVLFGVGYWVL